jgi:cell division protease FtsH
MSKYPYPFSPKYYAEYLKRINSKNITIQHQSILDGHGDGDGDGDEYGNGHEDEELTTAKEQLFEILGIKIINEKDYRKIQKEEKEEKGDEDDEDDEDDDKRGYRNRKTTGETLKSENFEVIKKYNLKFKNVGGYQNIKEELIQCIDILKNYHKYIKFNVRTPKGLILEGPPGNGKTLLAKAMAGESLCGFIPVSGSDFQEKYIGVGSARIKELFKLAKKNIPCIIFIDEIDALGRKRSSDGESSSSAERDNTLNALLVELDGFKNNTGIFVVGATNRADLLDSALIRPGRIDKKIYINLPDVETREAILTIHIKGKPHDATVLVKELIEVTEGFSGAQIENVLNEAMLYALKENREYFTAKDIDIVLNKIMAGWQPGKHQFSNEIIDKIAIHEMGHAITGFFTKHHPKMKKAVINLSSPKTPGYTIFEGSTSNLYVRESLFEHLMILLSGRIAEELFYKQSVTTGAMNDFEEALKLAEKMIVYYGMGKKLVYSNQSEKYKEIIDTEVMDLINHAYECASIIIENNRDLIRTASDILIREKIIYYDDIMKLSGGSGGGD